MTDPVVTEVKAAVVTEVTSVKSKVVAFVRRGFGRDPHVAD